MATISATYLGDLRVECTHNQSGTKIITDAPVIPLHYLPLCAGLAMKAGMDEYDALRAITINPAEHIGVADRVGSLEEGKDADIVIMDGTPFTVEGVVKHVFIDGEEI